jgi:hypothetical protein
MRLRGILGGKLQLLRQDRQQRCKVRNDAFLQGRKASHDALHDVLVLCRRLQLEGTEQALKKRLGQRGQVGGRDQSRTLGSTGYAHDQDLEKG